MHGVSTCKHGLSRSLCPTHPRAGLAFWAVERRAVHELLPPHDRTTPAARLTLAAVGVQRSLEVARFAVDVDVQRVERRPALAQRLGHHRGGGVEQFAELLTRQ